MRDRRDYQKKTSQRLAVAAMSVLPYAVIFAVVCVSWSLGVLGPIDRFLMDQRFWIIEREASGGLALVAIDPQSLKEEDQWPWPRDRYATAVINLQNAGAALVGFDVDFSSLSDPLGDAAFADALARRPGDVILPVFSQQSVEGGVVTTPPNSFFMQDAVIASVNLTPEKNGLVRQGWRGVQEGDAFRGSMASVLAGTAGASNERFYIDFSIDPASIPRLSFNDVLRNDFPAELVSGKKVIIGATALELGDEFAAPTRGVLPGVVLHVLSYESLVQGRTISRLHFCVPLLLALGVVIWFVSRSRTWSWPGFMARNAALFAILIAAPLALQAAAPVSLDTGAMLLAQMLCVVFVTGKRINQHAVQIIRQRAATAHYQALTRLVVQDSADGVIVTDDSGVIELLSPRAQALLGLDAPTEAGGFLQDYVDEFPLQTPPDGETVTTEFTVAGEDARTLEILSTSAGRMLDSDGKSTTRRLVVYTLRDVSIRKRIEAAERKAKEAAIAADAMKTQLISNMSHELRTPLNGIIG
ncbi:MAG: CHASE2 domain-containing protein, partial [Hyphococcus sp.]